MAALRPPLEEHTGFEPAIPAWKAGVLPLTPMLRITAGLSMSGGAGLCLLSAKKERRHSLWQSSLLPWRAEPDSNRLPLAVLASVLPKAPSARIAATWTAITNVWDYVAAVASCCFLASYRRFARTTLTAASWIAFIRFALSSSVSIG